MTFEEVSLCRFDQLPVKMALNTSTNCLRIPRHSDPYGSIRLVKRQEQDGITISKNRPIEKSALDSSNILQVLVGSRPPCVSFLREKGLGTTGATGGVALTCGHVTGFQVWIPVVGFGFRGSPKNGGIPGRYPNRLDLERSCLHFFSESVIVTHQVYE